MGATWRYPRRNQKAIPNASTKRKGVKPLMTSFSVYNLARNNCFDSTKAMRELGYRTRSYQETMHDEIQWLIETGKVKTPAAREKAMKVVPVCA